MVSTKNVSVSCNEPVVGVDILWWVLLPRWSRLYTLSLRATGDTQSPVLPCECATVMRDTQLGQGILDWYPNGNALDSPQTLGDENHGKRD